MGRKEYELGEDEWRGGGEAGEWKMTSHHLLLSFLHDHYTSCMIIGDKKTEIKSYRAFLPQINIQCIANILTYDDIELQNKAIEIQQESSKSSDENWSQIPKFFKYGHISALILFTKKFFFVSEIIKQCIANERIDAYSSSKNLSSNKNEIRHGCCDVHLIKFGITIIQPTESTILYTTTVEGGTF